MIGGSDAHTLRRVGRTWTEAPGRTRDEFLTSLREGLGGRAAGTADADGCGRRVRRDRPLRRLAGRLRTA